MNYLNNMIGKIVEFFPETQTATVKLCMSEIISTERSNYENTEVANLVDVVCHFPKVGGFSITTPVQKDDYCMVIFQSRGISHWLYEERDEYKVTKGRPEPTALRKNSLQDAICIVGISNILKPIIKFSPEDLDIRNTDRSQRMTLLNNGNIEVVTELLEGEEVTSSTKIVTDNIGNITLDSLKGDTNQTIKIKDDKSIEALTGDSKIEMLFDGTINVNCKTANIDATTETNITTPTANFSADVNIGGNLVVTGESTAADHISDGISGKSHTHKITSGSSAPGPTDLPQ